MTLSALVGLVTVVQKVIGGVRRVKETLDGKKTIVGGLGLMALGFGRILVNAGRAGGDFAAIAAALQDPDAAREIMEGWTVISARLAITKMGSTNQEAR